MLTEAATAARQRATEALDSVARQYGTDGDMATLRAAGDDWRDLALAQLAEAVEALLLDIRPRPGTVMRRRR